MRMLVTSFSPITDVQMLLENERPSLVLMIVRVFDGPFSS
jgi:hypothetical protein